MPTALGEVQQAWISRHRGAGSVLDVDLHSAYHAKYDRYGPRIVGTVVSPESARATLRLVLR